MLLFVGKESGSLHTGAKFGGSYRPPTAQKEALRKENLAPPPDGSFAKRCRPHQDAMRMHRLAPCVRLAACWILPLPSPRSEPCPQIRERFWVGSSPALRVTADAVPAVSSGPFTGLRPPQAGRSPVLLARLSHEMQEARNPNSEILNPRDLTQANASRISVRGDTAKCFGHWGLAVWDLLRISCSDATSRSL